MDNWHQKNQSHYNWSSVYSYLNFRFSVREVVINDVLKEICGKKKDMSASTDAGNYETRTQTRALIWSQENNLQIKRTHQLFYRHAKEVWISILYV